MKRLVLLAGVALLALNPGVAQDVWNYVGGITFPLEDSSYVRPYSCTVTANGNLYVISSTVTTVNARNMFYVAQPGATVMTKLIDYYETGDTTVIRHLRGIGSVGDDVLINGDRPLSVAAGGSGCMFYYPGGEILAEQRFGYQIEGAGHGTIHHGVALSKDTIAFAGITFNTSIRLYNFAYGRSSPARGSWISLTTYPLEPGGPHSNGFDVIRDCAVLPAGDYADTNAIWYTSRNSSDVQSTGGIALWRGGTTTNPGSYRGERVLDPFGALSLGPSVSYGITVDRNNYLWVAGNDSTRRWVKAFDMTGGVLATEVYDLPSKYHFSNPDPAGAPMINPVDVALSPDGRTAYVPDASARVVHKFELGPVSVGDQARLPREFRLEQNFPNPFNPSTTIAFTLPHATHVRLDVTNALGQHVATLADGTLGAGKHVRLFDAGSLASGIYFYRMNTDAGVLTRSMVLVR